jgi:hypothetical protein
MGGIEKYSMRGTHKLSIKVSIEKPEQKRPP